MRYRFADVELHSTRELPELTPLAGDYPSADVIDVQWPDARPPAPVSWFHRWGDDGDDWARFGETAEGWVVDFPTLAEFRIDRRAEVVSVIARPDVPSHTVHHLLLNQVLPLMLSRSGRVVLHAGAVAIDGRAVVFAGPTGSGKSTLVAACAQAGAEVLCDDSLVVYRSADGWMGVPSYPALRLWLSALERVGWTGRGRPAAHYTEKHRVGVEYGQWRFADGPRLLTRLVFLEHDEPPRPVAVELYSQVFRLDMRDTAEAITLFHVVADLAGSVPIVRLGPRETRDAMAIAARLCRGGDIIDS